MHSCTTMHTREHVAHVGVRKREGGRGKRDTFRKDRSMGGKDKMPLPGAWRDKERVRQAKARAQSDKKSKVRSHTRKLFSSPKKQALLPNARTSIERWDKMTPAERDMWLKDVDTTVHSLRDAMQEERPVFHAECAHAGQAESADLQRRSPRLHDKFPASPTKDGTRLEDMTGDSSSVGIWLRSSPFSVKKANGFA